MHEITKSRPPTPQSECVKPGVADTLQLLQKWKLLELKTKFQEHDISLRSLIYLTDEEICELIPKIGTRTIFRAMLKEWRQSCDSRASTSAICDMHHDSYLDHIELKAEYLSEGFHINNYEAESFKQQLQQQQQQEKVHHLGSTNEETKSPTEIANTRNLRNQLKFEEKPFIVLDILSSCTDGQIVLEFYKINHFLDIKNRKRLVNLLIRHVIELKIKRYTAIFHDMTRQLLEIFPTEKYETYFVPHNGANSARGALYYRYSNYTRQLRKEGLLAYKKNKPNNYNNLTK